LLSDRPMRAVLYLPLLLLFVLREVWSAVYWHVAYPQNRALRRRLAQSAQSQTVLLRRPLEGSSNTAARRHS
jgi:hypothetical protein